MGWLDDLTKNDYQQQQDVDQLLRPAKEFIEPKRMKAQMSYQLEQRKLENKKQFWNGLAKLQTAGSGTLGALWGRITLGIPDLMIAKVGQIKAFNELEAKTSALGYKIDKVSDDQWVLDREGEKSSINPFKATEGWYARDLGELNARMSGYDLEPEDRLFYNLGKFFGSVKSIGGGAAKLTPKAAMIKAPNITRIMQTGATGTIYEAINQFQQKIEGGDFSFKDVLTTGGIFTLFGVGEVGLKAIADVYRMQKFLRTPEGAGLIEAGLSRADVKKVAVISREASKMARARSAKDLLNAKKLYQPQGIDVPGTENVSTDYLNKLIAEPTLTPQEFERFYGKDLTRIAEKLDRAKAARMGKKIGVEAPADEPTPGIIRSDRTDVPLYDQWMKNPEYARKNKGVELSVQWMAPDEYLKESSKVQGVTSEETMRMISEESQAFLRNKVESGEQLDMPYLDYTTGNQEGRNRAFLAKSMGQESIPVLVVRPTSTDELAMREDAIAKGKKIAQQDKAIEARMESDEVLGGLLRDIEGEPGTNVLYHGSPVKGLTKIKPGRGDYGYGVYLASERRARQDYAPGRKNVAAYVLGDTNVEPPEGFVYPVQSPMKNPLVINTEQEYTKLLDEHGDSDKGIGEFARKAGYDGIINNYTEEHIVFTDKPIAVAQSASAAKAPSVYSSMPIEETRALASYGVKGAQDYLSEIADPEWFAPAIEPASMELKQKVVDEAIKRGINLTSLKDLSRYLSGVEDFTEGSTEEVQELLDAVKIYPKIPKDAVDAITQTKEPLVDTRMLKEDHKRLAKLAGNVKVFNRAINYSNSLGGAPETPGQYSIWMDDLREITRSMRRHEKRIQKSRLPKHKVKMINQYQSINYALDMVERRSGYLVRRMYQDTVADVTGSLVDAEAELLEMFKTAKVHLIGKGMSSKANSLIKAWLNESDEPTKAEWLRQMDAPTKRLAEGDEGLLQGPVADAIRTARWLKWETAVAKGEKELNDIRAAGKEPTKAQMKRIHKEMNKDKPFNAPREAITDGRIALSMGQFDAWISAQTWGTVKDYYMHKHELDDLLGPIETGSIGEEVFQTEARAGTFGIKAPGATEARKGEGSIIESDNVQMDILRHYQRALAFNKSYKFLIELNKTVKGMADEGLLTEKDLGAFRMIADTLRGIHHSTPDIVRQVNRVNRFFWPSFLVGDPRNSVMFAYKQLFQNFILAPSQLNLVEVAKSIARFPHINRMLAYFTENPEAHEAFKRYYVRTVQESKSLYRHFMLKNAEGSGLTFSSDWISRIMTLADTLSFVPGVTDRANRWMIWPIAHDIATRNLRLYASGEVNEDQLWRRLKITNMTPGFSMEFIGLLRDRQYEELANRYAEYKTENIHGRYNPLLRGVQEMTITGRTFLNLIVFPRLSTNTAWKNGVEPMFSRRPGKVIAGATTVLKAVVAAYLADRTSKAVTGYSSFGWLQLMFGGWSLGSPGLQITMEAIDNVSMSVSQASQSDKPVHEVALGIVKSFEGSIEDLIFISDAFCDTYALANNVDERDITIWKLIARASRDAYERDMGKKFRYKDRDTRDKLVLMILGRSPREKKEEEQPKNVFRSSRKSIFERKR